MSLEDIKRKVNSLHEVNPMLGFRGCRLGIRTHLRRRARAHAMWLSLPAPAVRSVPGDQRHAGARHS